ncbi:MAG: hypothetical protein SGPRY_014294, partial [Prymnesium sp.]
MAEEQPRGVKSKASLHLTLSPIALASSGFAASAQVAMASTYESDPTKELNEMIEVLLPQ